MFWVYEVNTGLYIANFLDERLAWSAANLLNDAHSEAMGLEYSVKVAGGDND
jgi:hypothetical protein